MSKTVIYDVGANNGDDIPYYLLKADVVVAIEANPVLCSLMQERFAAELAAGRLAIENCVVTAEGNSGLIDFYIHKSNHVLSQLPSPGPNSEGEFDKVVLRSSPICDLFEAHGSPYYVKIDIERYDALILGAMFRAGVFPPFISAEAHTSEVFALLVAQGGYNAFKLVDGRSVSKVYSNRLITRTPQGDRVRHAFPFHSAGPFGNDVDGPWMTADNFVRVLALEGFGWKDIHATNREAPNPGAKIGDRDFLMYCLLKVAEAKAPKTTARLQRMLSTFGAAFYSRNL